MLSYDPLPRKASDLLPGAFLGRWIGWLRCRKLQLYPTKKGFMSFLRTSSSNGACPRTPAVFGASRFVGSLRSYTSRAVCSRRFALCISTPTFRSSL